MGISVCGLLCTSLFMLHLAAGDARPIRDDEPGLPKRPRKRADPDVDVDVDADDGEGGGGGGGGGGGSARTHVGSKTAPKPRDGRKRKDGRDDLRYDRDRSNMGDTLLRKELIFEPKSQSFRTVAMPSIIELDRGEMLVSFMGGMSEGKADTACYTARLYADEDTWAPPKVAVAAKFGVPCWNPVLLKLPEGEVILFYKRGPSRESWSGFLRRSADGGDSWGREEPLPAGIVGPSKNKPLILPEDQSLLCPTNVWSFEAAASYVEKTPDFGRHWIRHGPIVAEEGGPLGGVDPSIYFTDDGTLVALMRPSDPGVEDGRVLRSSSGDGGVTWTPIEPTQLKTPNSGFDAVKLSDGRVVVTHNFKNMGTLRVVVSIDDGETWEAVHAVEDSLGGRGGRSVSVGGKNGAEGGSEHSNPAVIHTSDNMVHMVYVTDKKSVKHVVLDPEQF